MRRLFPNSLAFRLLAITAAWTVIALLVTGILLSTFVRQTTENNFQRLLQAHTSNIMGAIGANDENALIGSPSLSDPLFQIPQSGWYWSVSKVADPQKPILWSRSISGDPIDIPDGNAVPYDSDFGRSYVVTGPQGGEIQRVEAQLAVGEPETLYLIMVAGNKSEVENGVHAFRRTLVLFFSLFGLGTILATYFVVRLGLSPLSKAASSLQDVREGKADFLEGSYPKEIQPLATEINALINANRSIIDRARTQVGNLAHALKTPLAVIMNETRTPTKESSNTVSEQAQLMRSQIQTYLDRARIAAQRNIIGGKTDVEATLERLIRVMNKLSENITFTFNAKQENMFFKGEAQDLEEAMGNLLENAGRFATSKVVIEIEKAPTNPVLGRMLRIVVEDDGPGLSLEERQEALKRGIRLDETQPGSGLGLSIVRDIASEYGGEFNLEEGAMGGLKTVLILPRVAAT